MEAHRKLRAKGVANPVRMIWSAAEMLRCLDKDAASRLISQAIERASASEYMTRDLGGSADTRQVVKAILDQLCFLAKDRDLSRL